MKLVTREEALASIGAPGACGMCAMEQDAAHVVDTNAHGVTLVAPFAARPWHLVVALRGHVEDVARLELDAWLGLQTLAHRAARALDRLRKPRRVYVASLGSAEARPMSFPHVHVHVVPLEDGGEADRPSRVFTWTEGVLVYEPGERADVARALREILG